MGIFNILHFIYIIKYIQIIYHAALLRIDLWLAQTEKWLYLNNVNLMICQRGLYFNRKPLAHMSLDM